jgi:hypothetical protein
MSEVKATSLKISLARSCDSDEDSLELQPIKSRAVNETINTNLKCIFNKARLEIKAIKERIKNESDKLKKPI